MTLTEDDLRAMAQAHRLNLQPPHETPAGSTSRWATWDECCKMKGWEAHQIAAMRAAVEAVSGWRPIETAPRDRDILVCGRRLSIHVGSCLDGRWFDAETGTQLYPQPEYWMPLLPMPEAAS